MPPRYAYWTILVDGQPTAFRAAMQEDLMPTFKRLKQKHPSAEMKWFQNGKLWDSRIDAQESMRERGDRGRMGDSRQLGRRSFSEGGGGFRDRKRAPQRERRDWEPKSQAPSPKSPERLEWKPKGEFTPAPKRADRPDWKPKGAFTPAPKRADRPTRSFDRDRKPEWKPKGTFDRDRKPQGERPEWRPKSQAPSPRSPEKRKWIPKEEYKKSKGIERPRDSKWRPGGEHRDPRQKYKDAKKAKWTKFKKDVRQRWESKKKKP